VTSIIALVLALGLGPAVPGRPHATLLLEAAQTPGG